MELDQDGIVTQWDDIPESAKYIISRIRNSSTKDVDIVMEGNYGTLVELTFRIDGAEACVEFLYDQYPEIMELKNKLIEIALHKMDLVNYANRQYLKRVEQRIDKALLPDDIRDKL